MSYSVDAPKARTRGAWTPSRRSATWWQLHKTRGLPAMNPTVTAVDPASFAKWGTVVNATIVEAEGQPIALDAELHADAADSRIEVRWTEKLFGIPISRRTLVTLA